MSKLDESGSIRQLVTQDYCAEVVPIIQALPQAGFPTPDASNKKF
jgi:hypothetical protein